MLTHSSVCHSVVALATLVPMLWIVTACDTDSSAGAEGITIAHDSGSDCQVDEPPAVLLTSLGGEQSGVQGSYCVSNVADGCGACADRHAEPHTFTVVHPDDEIVISMPSGMLVSGTRCQPACPPTLRIQRLGCEEEYQTTLFDEDRPLMLGLPAGAYAVWADSHFEANSGLTGGLYVGFGLVVDATQERAVIDMDAGALECRPEDQDGGPELDSSTDSDAGSCESLTKEHLQTTSVPCVPNTPDCVVQTESELLGPDCYDEFQYACREGFWEFADTWTVCDAEGGVYWEDGDPDASDGSL
jgi:hypothetical protein